nr:TadE/TadG family type IV pilus assembly protein [Alteraurantiacibacter aestuarii]
MRCELGATIVEFALVAPVFFIFLFGTIETSRLVWMQQTLDEVAYSTARCISVSSSCDTATEQRDYAVSRASGYGIGVANGNVAPQVDVTCRGFPGSSRVKITHAFDSVMGGLVPVFPSQIVVEGCYPTLS